MPLIHTMESTFDFKQDKIIISSISTSNIKVIEEGPSICLASTVGKKSFAQTVYFPPSLLHIRICLN